MAYQVKDAEGKTLFWVEPDNGVGRDDSGKPVAFENAFEGGVAERVQLASTAAQAVREGARSRLRLMAARKNAERDGGRKILMDLGITDVAQPGTVAEFGFPMPSGVADIVSPVHFVTHATGTWFPETPIEAIQVIDDITGAAGAGGNMTSMTWTPTTFSALEYALGVSVPRHTMQNADFNLKRRVLRRCARALLLAREVRVATLLTTAANWNAGNKVTIAAGNKWNLGATATQLADIFNALAASVLPATVLVLPENAAQYFYANANSTLLRDYVQSGGELPNVVYAREKRAIAGVPQYIWSPSNPTNIVLVRVPDPDVQDVQETIPTSMTFRWLGEDAKDAAVVEGLCVRSFWNPSTESWVTVVVHNDAEVLMSSSAGLQVGALLVGALQ